MCIYTDDEHLRTTIELLRSFFVALKGHDSESVEAKAKKVSVIPNDVGRGSIRDR